MLLLHGNEYSFETLTHGDSKHDEHRPTSAARRSAGIVARLWHFQMNTATEKM
jgi:hypothetical protein